MQLTLHLYYRLEKCFEVVENVKKLNFEGNWAELLPKLYLLRQSQTKYLTKVEKSSKIGHERKSLISAFACFLTAIAKD